MRRWSLPSFFGLILVCTLSSCDSGSDADGNGNGNGNETGQANITVSGDVEDSFSGNAVFGVDPDADGGYGVAIFEGAVTVNPTGKFVAIQRDMGQPAEGTYSIDNDGTAEEFFGVYSTNLGSGAGATFIFPESGQLTITISAPNRLAGSFTFSGSVIIGGSPQGTATVRGTFDAERGDAGLIPDAF